MEDTTSWHWTSGQPRLNPQYCADIYSHQPCQLLCKGLPADSCIQQICNRWGLSVFRQSSVAFLQAVLWQVYILCLCRHLCTTSGYLSFARQEAQSDVGKAASAQVGYGQGETHLDCVDAEEVADAPEKAGEASRPGSHPHLQARQLPPERCQQPEEADRRAACHLQQVLTLIACFFSAQQSDCDDQQNVPHVGRRLRPTYVTLQRQAQGM